MTKEKEALKLALEALEMGLPLIEDFGSKEQFNIQHKAITAIYETLAQPAVTESHKQEPMAWEQFYPDMGKPKLAYLSPTESPDNACYIPPQRTWVGLTEDDKVLIKHDANFNQFMTAGEYADRVQQLTEARLKDLNT